MLVSYYVTIETAATTASFYFYKGEHSEAQIDDMNHKISDFIRGLTNGTER